MFDTFNTKLTNCPKCLSTDFAQQDGNEQAGYPIITCFQCGYEWVEQLGFEALLAYFIDKNHLFRLEGETGLANFTRICESVGYRENGFKWGTPIEQFLADNSGAIEALVEFIVKNASPQWQENLESHL